MVTQAGDLSQGSSDWPAKLRAMGDMGENDPAFSLESLLQPQPGEGPGPRRRGRAAGALKWGCASRGLGARVGEGRGRRGGAALGATWLCHSLGSSRVRAVLFPVQASGLKELCRTPRVGLKSGAWDPTWSTLAGDVTFGHPGTVLGLRVLICPVSAVQPVGAGVTRGAQGPI